MNESDAADGLKGYDVFHATVLTSVDQLHPACDDEVKELMKTGEWRYFIRNEG